MTGLAIMLFMLAPITWERSGSDDSLLGIHCFPATKTREQSSTLFKNRGTTSVTVLINAYGGDIGSGAMIGLVGGGSTDLQKPEGVGTTPLTVAYTVEPEWAVVGDAPTVDGGGNGVLYFTVCVADEGL
jgi:hypothetical protein